MLNHPTYDKLTRLNQFGMAHAFAEQSVPDLDHVEFEERLGLLIRHEVSERDNKALVLRLQWIKLKHTRPPRTRTNATHVAWIRRCTTMLDALWLQERQNVLLTGLTGVGKTWLACTLAHQTCYMGLSAYYVRLLRQIDKLRIGRADGHYMKLIKQLAKIDVLVIDERGLAVLDDAHRRNLV